MTLTRAGELLLVIVHWVPQPWDIDDPPASNVSLYRVGLPDTLEHLGRDLAEHLQRPLRDLADRPFVGLYEIGAGHAQITLEFAATAPSFVSTESMGGGALTVRWRSNTSTFEIAFLIDISTLDRFSAQLAVLVAGDSSDDLS